MADETLTREQAHHLLDLMAKGEGFDEGMDAGVALTLADIALQIDQPERAEALIVHAIQLAKETEDGDCCIFGPGWNGTLDNSGKPLNSASFAYILKGTYRNGEGFYLTGNIILK